MKKAKEIRSKLRIAVTPQFPILQLNTEPHPHNKSPQRVPELEGTSESGNQMSCQRALLLDKDTGNFPLQRTLWISPAQRTNEVLKSKPRLHKVGDGISYLESKNKDVKPGCSRVQTHTIIVLFHDKSTHRPSKDSHFTLALYKKERKSLICAAVWIVTSSSFFFLINLGTGLRWAFKLFQKIWEGVWEGFSFIQRPLKKFFKMPPAMEGGGRVCACTVHRLVDWSSRCKCQIFLITKIKDKNNFLG